MASPLIVAGNEAALWTWELEKKAALRSHRRLIRLDKPLMDSATRRWFRALRRSASLAPEVFSSGDASRIADRIIDWQKMKTQGERLWGKAVVKIIGDTGVRISEREVWKADPIGAWAVRWARKNVATLVTGVIERTRNAIRETIIHGFRQQYGVEKLARLLRPLLGLTEGQAGAAGGLYSALLEAGTSEELAIAKVESYANHLLLYRTETISRTETSAAASAGVLATYEDYGIEAVDIVSSADSCDLCAEAASKSPYSISEAEGMLPLHPRCECCWVKARA